MKLQYAKIVKRGGPRPFHVYGGHSQREEVWSFRGAFETEEAAKAVAVEMNDAGIQISANARALSRSVQRTKAKA